MARSNKTSLRRGDKPKLDYGIGSKQKEKKR